MAEPADDDALTRRQKMFNNRNLSDVTIHYCDGRKLFAHKMILSLSSPYFAKLYSDPEEAEASQLHLEDSQDGDAVHAMICHIYGVEMPKPGYWQGDAAEFWTELMSISGAQDYDVPACFQLATAELREELVVCSRLPEQLSELYATEGEHRRVAAEVCRDKLSHYLKDEEFMSALSDVPDLAIDILRSMSEWVAPESKEPASKALEPKKRRRIAEG